MSAPHILFIMTDQQRWDSLGCYGNETIETTHLDWLACEGTQFDHAYTPSPSCVPARAALLTGMDPWHTGILGTGKSQGQMGSNYPQTMPGELAKNGYHTLGVGKMNFSPQRSLNGFHQTILDEGGKKQDPGFESDYEQWFQQHKTAPYGSLDHGVGWNDWLSRPFHAPEYLHPTNWTVNEALNHLETRDPTKPFFLKVSFTRPHSPYDPPEYYFDTYKDSPLPDPEVGSWANIHNDKKEAMKPDAWRGIRSKKDIQRARAGYYGSINHIDDQLGRLFDYLKRNRLWNETMIVFTSDHGDMLGDHHLWRKTYAYEGSTHIPLMIKLPQSAGKQVSRVKEPVQLQDVLPTLLDVATIPIPSGVDGVSLLPLMTSENVTWRPFVHGEHSACYADEQEMQFLTDGKMKYIWFPRTDAYQLFDLEKDPYEKHDVSKELTYKEDLEKWQFRLVETLKTRTGWTHNGHLISQKNKPYAISPYYEKWK